MGHFVLVFFGLSSRSLESVTRVPAFGAAAGRRLRVGALLD